MKNQVVAIYERLRKVTNIEALLIKRLGDELTRSDDRLLDDVKAVTARHDEKRAEILDELQHLAGCLGGLPRPDEHILTVDYEEIDLPDYILREEPENLAEGLSPAEVEDPWPAEDDAPDDAPSGADWRQAAAAMREKYEDLGFDTPHFVPPASGDEAEPVHH
ncbi:MAG: hypothetical protein ACR2O4_01170 [Hyphomicrobiaceae bacterium]